MNLRDLLIWLHSLPDEVGELTYKEHSGQVTLVVTIEGEEFESVNIEEYPAV